MIPPNLIERLIVDWLVEHYGFTADEHEPSRSSVYYGGRWIEFDFAPLAQLIAAQSLQHPSDLIRELQEALEKLAHAVNRYRLKHDLLGGEHIETGRAWDTMRRAEERAFWALETLTKSKELHHAGK